ncbi:hypothetical protein K505DRAFT_221910, partial [Melanomma pulvis-pyrius CBS 109.77]
FIWNAGSPFQRGQQYVLSSLLHQLLSNRPGIALQLLQGEKDLQHKKYTSDWSRKTVEHILFKAVKLTQGSICIFVDGLDEIDEDDGGGLFDFMQQIGRLRSLPNIKLCVSSRPETIIKKHLEGIPGLRLQDLNAHDIRTDGVFLWARLVVTSIRNGLIKYDDWEMLLQRVNVLPDKLSELYNDMWKRLNGDTELHRATSALYFKLLL